jgi:hypothetical protein
MALVEVPEPAPIEIVTREMLAINKERGYVDPETVVELATDTAHPLHPFFEWDNSEAGHAFRLIQAMGLIRKVRVKITTIDDGRGKSVRGFLPASIVGRDLPSYSYLSQDDIAADPAAREAVLRQMQRDISALERRYNTLDEFWQSVDALAKERRKKR